MEGCVLCRSKAGLTMHEKRMHRVAEERVRFACSTCGMNVETEGARKNHERSCTGGEIERDGRRECGRCGATITYGNNARHVRGCVRGKGERNDKGARGRVRWMWKGNHRCQYGPTPEGVRCQGAWAGAKPFCGGPMGWEGEVLQRHFSQL